MSLCFLPILIIIIMFQIYVSFSFFELMMNEALDADFELILDYLLEVLCFLIGGSEWLVGLHFFFLVDWF